MHSYQPSIQSLQDICDKIPGGDTSPTKGGYSLQTSQMLNSSHQIEQQNPEFIMFDILKPDAVKAIIREEIVNKGYDIIDFSQFLAVFQREKGPADGKWTMLKLYEVIIKFRETNTPTAMSDDSIFFPSTRGVSFLGQLSPIEEAKPKEGPVVVVIPSEKALRRETILGHNKDPYRGKIYVKKLEPTLLTNIENLVIRIDEAKTCKGGIFSSDYVSYTVKTDPMGWVTHRRAEEFVRLRNHLQRIHPGLIIPKFSKKTSKEKFGDDSIRKRIYLYERFLQDCFACKEIRSTKLFCDFLSGNDKGLFSGIMKKSEKPSKASKIQDLFTLTGEIQIDVSPDVSEYADTVEKYYNQADKVFIQLKKLSKKLAAELNSASNTLLEIGESYTDLHKLTSEFNKKVKVGKNKLESVFLELTKQVKNWSEHIQSQVISIRKNLVGFYSHASYEAQSYKERNHSRHQQQCEYERVERELNAKKENLFNLGDPDKWELDPLKARGIPQEELVGDKEIAFALMLDKESQQFRQLKDSYGYINYATYSEMIKGFDIQFDAYKENFKDFIKRQVDSTSQMYSDWADFVTGLEMTKGEKEKSSPSNRK